MRSLFGFLCALAAVVGGTTQGQASEGPLVAPPVRASHFSSNPIPVAAVGGINGADGSAAPAAGGPGEEAAGTSSESPSQSAIAATIAQLEAAIYETSEPGFAAIGAQDAPLGVILRWKGTVPSSVAAAAISASKTVPVTVVPADYSWRELDDVISGIRADQNQVPGLSPVVGFAMAEDMSGIEVYTDSPSAATDAVMASLIDRIPPGLPVAFRYAGWAANRENVEAGSRLDDKSPFVGGARIQNRSFFGFVIDSECTSAFAVRNQADTARGVLTAKHCGTNEDWETPKRALVGTSNLYASNSDAMGILWPTDTSVTPGFSGKIYIGSYRSTTTGGITGSGFAYRGELLCSSGSFSGVVCENRVIQANYYDKTYGGPMNVTRQTAGFAAAGNGDSGGAMYFLGSSPVRSARGIISLISIDRSDVRPCKGVPSSENRTCSRIVLSTSVQHFLNAMGLRVLRASY